MPIPFVPKIPDSIIVHLGSPSSYASNVRLPFVDYIKNVASSEIYPTWEEAALKANILAQISFALNRVYTEFYIAQGKDFDITNSTAIDQKFIFGRNTFDSTNAIVEEIFNNYIRRKSFIEPLAAKYCNGTTVTCDGLSQWGSQNLAQQGFDYMKILNTYYGNNIEIVENAPIEFVPDSYPGTPIKIGDKGASVLNIQTELNRISIAYPLIPKVLADGVYGQKTADAIKVFQQIFNLTPDGIVGKATWYKIIQLYSGLKKLSELYSEGQKYQAFTLTTDDGKTYPNSSQRISNLQYILSIIAEFTPTMPAVLITGKYDAQTVNAVKVFQRNNGLEETGVVDVQTWNMLYDCYAGIIKTQYDTLYKFILNTKPYVRTLSLGDSGNDVKLAQEQLNYLSLRYFVYKAVDATGYFGRQTLNAVETFQKVNSLKVNGQLDKPTWQVLQSQYYETIAEIFTAPTQFPFKELELGDTDKSLNRNYELNTSNPNYLLYTKPVTSLQVFLRELSKVYDLPLIIPDGIFGENTKRAVQKFQEDNNLIANGVVDKKTWDEIVSQYENKIKDDLGESEGIIIDKIKKTRPIENKTIN